jgi:hypothetical protein
MSLLAKALPPVQSSMERKTTSNFSLHRAKVTRFWWRRKGRAPLHFFSFFFFPSQIKSVLEWNHALGHGTADGVSIRAPGPHGSGFCMLMLRASVGETHHQLGLVPRRGFSVGGGEHHGWIQYIHVMPKRNAAREEDWVSLDWNSPLCSVRWMGILPSGHAHRRLPAEYNSKTNQLNSSIIIITRNVTNGFDLDFVGSPIGYVLLL